MEQKKKKKFRFSIKIKTTILVLITGIILVEVPMAYFSLVSARTNRETYQAKASSLSATIAEVVDAQKVKNIKDLVKPIVDSSTVVTTDDWNTPEWDTYISQFEPIISNEDYIYVRDYLRELQAVNSEEVYCFYIVYLDPNLQSYVYLVDNASDKEMWSPGTVDHINQEHKYLFDPNNTNEDMAPVISDQPGYGYLCTAGAPIKIGNEIIGYATVDLSMTVIRAKQVDSIIRLFIYLVITMVLLIVLALIVIHFWLNRPLKQLIDMTKAYDVNDPEGTHKKYQEFSVKSHDELEDLAESMKQLENDVYTTINELKESNKQLVETQQVATEMTELANKDGLTGVRNKVSYDAEVKKIDKTIKEKIPFRLGIAMIDLNYLKIINDEYGHRSGDAALIKLSNLISPTDKLNATF